mmetsp:Transcript_134474/g.335437  ORF Transcript_134474/g.335437 Transcript_134474/m.335437 type:complete len:404 (-) Transcript_134474:54-1265(-)
MAGYGQLPQSMPYSHIAMSGGIVTGGAVVGGVVPGGGADDVGLCGAASMCMPSGVGGGGARKDPYPTMREVLKSFEFPTAEPIEGNIYRYWAFGFRPPVMFVSSAQFAVMLIQLLAPVAICYEAVHKIRDNEIRLGFGDWHQDPLSTEPAFSFHSKRVLALLFVFCFVVNAYRTHMQDTVAWRKSYHLLKMMMELKLARAKQMYIDQQARKAIYPNPTSDTPYDEEIKKAEDKADKFYQSIKWGWLYADSYINGFTMILCCVGSLLCMAAAESVKDVVFDSVGLLFLFSLDDIASELGFLTSEDWPSRELGEFLEKQKTMVRNEYVQNYIRASQNAMNRGDASVTCVPLMVPEEPAIICPGCTPPDSQPANTCMAFTGGILWALMFLLPLMYIGLEGLVPRRA